MPLIIHDREAIVVESADLGTEALDANGYEEGDFSYSGPFLSWPFTTTGGDANSSVTVTSDNPRTGTFSAEFLFGGEPAGGTDLESDAHAELGLSVGNGGQEHSELWVGFWVWFSDGTEGLGSAKYIHRMDVNPDNNKFMLIGKGKDKSLLVFQFDHGEAFDGLDTSEGQSYLTVTFRHNGGGTGEWTSEFPENTPEQFVAGGAALTNDALRGRWNHFVCHILLQSADGAADGRVRCWYNGTLYRDLQNWTTWPKTGDPADNVLTGGYLMGYANSGFAEDTKVWIDDVELADHDIWGVSQ